MIEGLDKNIVDVSHTATPYLVEGVLKGSGTVGVVGGPANTIFSVIAKPGIKSFADLKGKMFAMSLPVDTISIASRLLLEKHGLKDTDYRTTEMIGTQTRAKCLIDGDCDAVPLGQPDDIVFMAKGYTKLGDSLEVIPVLQFNVIAARREWAAQNKDLVVRFARAFGDAYRFMRDPNNRDEVAAILTETTGAPPDVARAMLAFNYEPDRGVMPRQAEISLPGVAKVIELLGVTGALKAPLPAAERFVDLQYLKAAGLQCAIGRRKARDPPVTIRTARLQADPEDCYHYTPVRGSHPAVAALSQRTEHETSDIEQRAHAGDDRGRSCCWPRR